MLQPLQLEDVSIRHSNEIAELRDFFAKAGLALHTPESFGAVAARVRGDRAFSRDLTSHVWVFLHAGNRQVSYSDLLGMLAIAAAGPRFAASASDADAHDLLRFLMEARGAFDTLSAVRKEPSAPLPVITPLPVVAPPMAAVPAAILPTSLRSPQGNMPASFVRHAEPEEAMEEGSLPSFEMPQDEDANRPMVWFAVAACVLFLLLGGLWLFHASSANHNVAITATTEPAPVMAPSAVDATKSAAPQTLRQDEPAHLQSHTPHRPPAPVTSRSQLAARASSQPTPISLNPEVSAPQPAPAGRQNKPLPSMPLPSMARATPPETPGSSRLVRRSATPPPVINVPPLAASTSRNDLAPTGGPVRQATVRATSLGTMAGNVTYSPAPAYPQAASALHVQGEVKLEAEIDPTGSVVSTRIISGPPLLQAAAADAVQRWRYRPFLYNDKPIGMNTTVVMDFQLP
jgi:TonB family protein